LFEDIMSLTNKDVSILAIGFAERTVVNGKTVFGLLLTNLLKEATVHWAQDFCRIRREPSLDGIETIPDFKAATETAKQQAQIQKHSAKELDSLSTASHPGKIEMPKGLVGLVLHNLTNYL
jgi:hypothetical protein